MHIIFLWEIIVVSHRKKNASLTISTLQKSSSLCFPAFSAKIQWLNLDIIIRRCRLTVLWFLEFNYWIFPACNFKSLQWTFLWFLFFTRPKRKNIATFFLRSSIIVISLMMYLCCYCYTAVEVKVEFVT